MPAIEQMAGTAVGMPWDWDADPLVMGLLFTVTAVYVAGMMRQRRERRLPQSAPRRAIAFGAGMLLLVVTLLSPLDAWGDHLFAAHMAQHLVLMMLAPPLLVLGRPFIVALWAMPIGGRRAVGAWWLRRGRLRLTIDVLMSPLAAWLLASAALWFWHLPQPYVLAFRNPSVHAAEHLSFFLTAILFWRVVIDGPPSGRLSLGATMIFVFTFAMENAMLAALLIFAPRVLYSVHAAAPAWSRLTPLEDQQLAGVLMWAVTSAVDLLALGLLFVALLDSAQRRSARA
jgi:cytochrome c oxidase assembly factor CtaG